MELGRVITTTRERREIAKTVENGIRAAIDVSVIIDIFVLTDSVCVEQARVGNRTERPAQKVRVHQALWRSHFYFWLKKLIKLGEHARSTRVLLYIRIGTSERVERTIRNFWKDSNALLLPFNGFLRSPFLVQWTDTSPAEIGVSIRWTAAKLFRYCKFDLD